MRHLDPEIASRQQLATPLEDVRFGDLLQWLTDDPASHSHAPEQTCQLDPRDGSMVIYNPNRAHRYHTPTPEVVVQPSDVDPCPICDGAATHIVDMAPQSEGFTFISQNLYPILDPAPKLSDDLLDRAIYPDPQHVGRAAYGFHLLQWTSSIHGRDWHNMPVADLQICMQRLAVLEEKLVTGAGGYMPPSGDVSDSFGCFSLIKNWGGSAGASLSHGHQQIAFSNIMPQRAFNNWSFFRRHQRTFAQYILDENPAELTVGDWSHWRLLVPYFMQRPLSMLLLFKGHGLRHLHQLDENARNEMTVVLHLTIRLMLRLIPDYLKPPAYNFVMHTGPDNDLYVEFFPITQGTGGFERLGMWVCQERPVRAARMLRDELQRLQSSVPVA